MKMRQRECVYVLSPFSFGTPLVLPLPTYPTSASLLSLSLFSPLLPSLPSCYLPPFLSSHLLAALLLLLHIYSPSFSFHFLPCQSLYCHIHRHSGYSHQTSSLGAFLCNNERGNFENFLSLFSTYVFLMFAPLAC